LFSHGSNPRLTGCTFSENSAALGGGVFWHGDPDVRPALTACIIAFGTQGGGLICWGAAGVPTLRCCDIYGNAGGDWVGHIASQYGANGNFSADPLFCGNLNPEEPYALRQESPCAAANSPGCGLIGAWDVGCGWTPVQRTSWGAVKAMFR